MTVEEYIKEYTRNCSNELAYKDESGKSMYHPWLTPENAEAVAMIAREETITKACEFFYRRMNDVGDVEFGDIEGFIEDFKKVLED